MGAGPGLEHDAHVVAFCPSFGQAERQPVQRQRALAGPDDQYQGRVGVEAAGRTRRPAELVAVEGHHLRSQRVADVTDGPARELRRGEGGGDVLGEASGETIGLAGHRSWLEDDRRYAGPTGAENEGNAAVAAHADGYVGVDLAQDAP